MRFLSNISEFIDDLRVQKLRTLMTVFGIVWGTVAIMVLLAFGNGLERQIMKSMYGIGENIILLFPGRTARPFQGYGVNRRIRLMEDDASLLESEIAEIQSVSPEYSTWNIPLKVRTNVRTPNLTGVVPVYGDIRNVDPARGSRFINDEDMRYRRRVIFLGDVLAGYLFGQENPVGKQVMMGNIPVTVIGVMEHKEQDSSYNARDEDRAFIPASTFASIYGFRYINNVVIKPGHPTLSPHIIDRVYEVLGKKYKFDPSDREALSIWDTTEFQKMVYYIFLGFNIFMGIIGSFTLTVGGVGVANIMYVVVQERTAEIGIKRSVGAKRKHIMAQFFIETFFIVAVGAIIGLIISIIILFLISKLPIEQYVGTPRISWWVALVALGLLGFIGFIAGFFPSRRAASLNVIDCIHH